VLIGCSQRLLSVLLLMRLFSAPRAVVVCSGGCVYWAQPTPAERAAADAAASSTKGGGGMLRWVCLLGAANAC